MHDAPPIEENCITDLKEVEIHVASAVPARPADAQCTPEVLPPFDLTVKEENENMHPVP